MLDTGLYWRPLGGNNIDQISGHCYQYTCVERRGGRLCRNSIIVDLGKFDNFGALGVKDAIAAVPDIRAILTDKQLGLRGIFLTHSHPDHLNGIFHYLRAGYKLPTLYGGAYTKIVLDDMYDYYGIKPRLRPRYVVITAGDRFAFDGLNIEVVSASHTCFDAFGFIISKRGVTVYHSGDMKLDNTTFFKKPTDVKRLQALSGRINYAVADFCEIDQDGISYRERDVYKTFIDLIKKSRKHKVYLTVYPTHVEMYIIAFLVALKLRKNVVFHGDAEFYDYLKTLRRYGIDFQNLALSRIKVFYQIPEDISELGNEFVIIGSYRRLDDKYFVRPKDSIAFITARYHFAQFKKQAENLKIQTVTLNDYPLLRGSGHAFMGDWEILRELFPKVVFIPTHCPDFVLSSFCELGHLAGFRLINPLPHNNMLYRLRADNWTVIEQQPALWMVASTDKKFTAVPQCPTAGKGGIKRTYSRRRVVQKFKILEYKLEKNHGG
ncbi:MAG: hypothetical protein IJ184_03615 [Alphaproteobacteria bacterium]|nr:hypothetical protein [Alphaproteobacteria bacterium]